MIYESNYYVGSDLNGDSLSHHGVPNQRWGVKNGPPYPVRRGHDVHYNTGKMTDKTKDALRKSTKAVAKAAGSAGAKVKSSFQNWVKDKKSDLATRETDSRLLKNWQKKQLRISDMTNQELQQRIDRKKLEETYKHALRGDFSDPKTWNKSSKDAKSGKGKEAADGILKKIGDAAVDGLTKGLSSKIEQSMTAKAKAKVARREARRDAIEEVMRDAARERAQYSADKGNRAWKERQERKDRDWEYWRSTRSQSSGDGAMDPTMGWGSGPSRRYRYMGITGSSGKPTGSYYYAGPGEGSVS